MLHTHYPGTGDGNTSYTASSIWLWIVPEQTCVFLVFCVPAWPRAFAKSTPLGRLLASMLSWTPGSVFKSRSGETKSWTPAFGPASGNRGHRLPDQDGHGVGLHDYKYGGAARKGTSDDYLSDATILRTTEVIQEEETVSKASSETRKRQHPW